MQSAEDGPKNIFPTVSTTLGNVLLFRRYYSSWIGRLWLMPFDWYIAFLCFSLLETVTTLESRCEDLQGSLDRVTAELENEKRRASSTVVSADTAVKTKLTNHVGSSVNEQHSSDSCASCSKVLAQLHESKATNAKDQRTIDDLREQVSLLLQVSVILWLLRVTFAL